MVIVLQLVQAMLGKCVVKAATDCSTGQQTGPCLLPSHPELLLPPPAQWRKQHGGDLVSALTLAVKQSQTFGSAHLSVAFWDQ